jgi:transcriptional regulator with XRE-family HTH domain
MNAEQLKKERARRDMTQAEMAAFLGVPTSTYIKWESDKTRKKPIPSLVADKLTETHELDLSLLSILEIAELEKLARQRSTTITKLMGEFIREGLKSAKGIIPLIIGGAIAFHLLSASGQNQGAPKIESGMGLEAIVDAVRSIFVHSTEPHEASQGIR